MTYFEDLTAISIDNTSKLQAVKDVCSGINSKSLISLLDDLKY